MCTYNFIRKIFVTDLCSHTSKWKERCKGFKDLNKHHYIENYIYNINNNK